MFIVKYYVLGALVLLATAFFTSNVYLAILLCWAALSLSVVSFAYIFNVPMIFRKKSNGSIPFYIRWLFVPFLMGVQLYNSWARSRDKVPAIQQIDEYLFLGCRLFSSDVDNLSEIGIKGVLDVTAEFDGLDWSSENRELDYFNIPVLDHKSPSLEKLQKAIHWLENHIKNNRAVVVHCALGRGRSVLVVAAYLLSQNPKLSVSEALDKIRGIRATANLNKHQLKALSEFHKQGKLKIKKTIWIIANPVSGGGKWPKNKAEIMQLLQPHFVINILETTLDKSAKELTREAKGQGAQVIVACGGDGTLTEVASELLNSKITMGILPMGTANALAHVLMGISSKLLPVPVACDAIIKGKSQLIDTATCNDELVLLLVGLGFEQQMIEGANREEKDNGGQFAYLNSLWNAVNRNQVQTYILQQDDEAKETLETSSLVIANAAPFSTILAQGGDGPDVSNGFLDLTWVKPQKSLTDNVSSLFELAFSGFLQDSKPTNIHHSKALKIFISSETGIDYVIDGESREAQNLSINVNPKSLKILCEQ
ncbi:diacylglycerol kinase family protein [uncultured Paraglaciecola sp.]|uniref:diacylglycerol kinase family protein n=1 Tax=uncultured Paraglaciecola sp. TaxID=1765024 RepID=UPI002635E167|nr:diacylglycerol kinase family protein [uncultured Paraglaciecola sp.]